MVKKLLTFILGLGLAFGASAQWVNNGNAAVPQDSIQYWVGTGSNQAVVAVTWNDETAGNIGIAWGVKWNGSATIKNLMDTLAAYDSRISYVWSSSGSFIQRIGYTDANLGLALMDNADMRCYNWQAASGTYYNSLGITSDVAANGDFIDWLFMDDETYETQPADVMLYATDPNASEGIDTSLIQYWIGTGSNAATFTLHFNNATNPVSLVWGYRWNDPSSSYTVGTMMAEIDATDSRVSFDGVSSGFLNSYSYTDENYTLSAPTSGNYAGFIMNNEVANTGLSGMPLANGDDVAWCDADMSFFMGGGINIGNPTIVYVSDPNAPVDTTTTDTTVTDTTVVAVDATIAAADILYWVGEGSNEVILAVNWADTALAWGYRFGTDSTTVTAVMNDIAAADWRFSYTPGAWGLGNIVYYDSIDSLYNIYDGSWMSTLNGNSNASAGMGTVLHNNDFFKWGDYMVATTLDTVTWAMVFTADIYPVSVPTHSVDTTITDTTIVDTTVVEHGPYCGPVGTEGCNAIAADSNIIVGWATGIVLNRGPQNISVEGSPLASYGTVDSAIGPATNNTMRAVSLGDGGTATITFAHPIRNGEGPDFAVFENGFENLVYGNYSLELAFVEVSSDGERFVRFPAASLTQTETQIANAGGIDPTMINNLAGKFEVGYGTPFDLAELADSTGINIDSIVYVRLVDVVGSIDPEYASYDAEGRIINDPFPTPFASSGFDLTGVAVMYERTDVVDAPIDATIAAEDIRYWVGEGENKVILAVNWADTALAWGYRFSTDSVSVQTVMEDIAEADPRFSFSGEGWLNDIVFTENGQSHSAITEGWWLSTLNGNSNASAGMFTMLADGDFFKWGDYMVAVTVDTVTWAMVFPATVNPVSEPDTNNSIAMAEEVSVSLWPNPVVDRLSVSVSSDCSAVLFDMAGRRIADIELHSGINSLDLGNLPAGIYMLRLGNHVEKVVKH